jgi:ATP-dependent Clp endopeptidase proteolytic subunit ClpP
MRNWFKVKALSDGSVDISIYDEIGGWGISAKDFIGELKAAQGKPIALSINSPGGSVFDALAMFNALRNHGAPVNVTVLGIAASAASLIAMAGDKITMPENTFMMIHNPLSWAGGNASELREVADTLDKIAEALVTTYVNRTGQTAESIKSLLDAETWLSAEEAVAMGFADEISPAFKVAAAFDVDRIPEYIRASVSEAAEAAEAAEADPAEADPAEADPDEADVEDTAITDPAYVSQASIFSSVIAKHGFSDMANVFLLDDKITTEGELTSALQAAVEIRDLCSVVNKRDLANGFITSKSTVADVRVKLMDALASDDESTHTSGIISTSKPSTEKPKATKTADIWASRRSKS